MATTVTSKGQVTIPKAVRKRLGLQPGSQRLSRRAEDGRVVLVRADGARSPNRFERLRGHGRRGPG